MLNQITSLESFPPPRRSGIPETQGSGLRFQDAKTAVLAQLKEKAKSFIIKEEIKAAQTFSPLDLFKIKQRIMNYRRAKGIK